MATVSVEKDFPAAAEVVWSALERTGDVADWIPSLRKSWMEGDVRHVEFADGSPARERIVALDGDRRTYTYTYVDGPLPLERYESTVRVHPAGEGACRVTWSADFAAGSPAVEQELAVSIEGMYGDALAGLAAQLTD
ncbi:SRPBCC family protein [Gordonia caeni]|uniref:SRPBCC family protein n=1 Tax=Gordonia caeni TaxID=1007097 RepID=A0ABP7NVC1_9ACTN